MEISLFKAGFEASLECCDIENNHFLQEYLKLGAISQLSKWKKLALRVDFDEGEKIIFDLLLSLKEDILRLEDSLDKNKDLLVLKQKGVVEDITKELHYLRKELGVKDEGDQEEEDYKITLLKEEIQITLEKQISAKITPVLRTLKTMEHIIEDFQNEQQNRILNLEQKAQSMTKLTPNYDTEEQKIVDLFKEGKSIEQIAKDLRIGTGNVELVLKFKQLIK
ncbi:DUF6115 domain-containing protein [Campylobacter coli]